MDKLLIDLFILMNKNFYLNFTIFILVINSFEKIISRLNFPNLTPPHYGRRSCAEETTRAEGLPVCREDAWCTLGEIAIDVSSVDLSPL